MRILITGFVVFVIWSFFSVWIYVEKLNPIEIETKAIQSTPIPQATKTDSVVQIEPIKPNDMIIYFGFNETRINDYSPIDNKLNELKNWLDKNPLSTLLIQGHTDAIGTSKYNQKLGNERALSVQKYFLSKGFDSLKINSESEGENQPISDQSTEEGRAKNRRAVITIKN